MADGSTELNCHSCCSAEQLRKRAEGTCLQLDPLHTDAKGDPSCQTTGCSPSSTENTWARHHLTKGLEEQQVGVTHGSAKEGGNQNMAAGGTAVSGRLLQLHNGCSDHALAIGLTSPFSCTECKQYIQLTLLTLLASSVPHC